MFTIVAAAAASTAGTLRAQQPSGPAISAAAITANVARIRAGNRSGFGFIVGLDTRRLIVATALHTIDGPGGDAPELCFPHAGETCAAGRVLYVADAIGTMPSLDLAFLSVPYPPGLAWRPDVEASRSGIGAAVRSIGRGAEWFVPDAPGRITHRDPEWVRYAGLSLSQGVSGAPIVADDGIVAMHVQSFGETDGARGIALAAIRRRLDHHAAGRWALVPPADCAGDAVHRGTLTGRAITVRFAGSAPGAALGAAARLTCLGARVLLDPVWDEAAWPGAGITYRSGDVRLMRTIQSVLAPFGRLGARLGAPGSGDAEVRVR